MQKIIDKVEIFFEQSRIIKIAKKNNINFTKKNFEEQIVMFYGEEKDIYSILKKENRTNEEKRLIEIKTKKYYTDLSINIDNFYFIEKARKKEIKRLENAGINGDIKEFITDYPYLIKQVDLYKVSNGDITENTLLLFAQRFFNNYKSPQVIQAVDGILDLSPDAYLSFVKYTRTPELKYLLNSLIKDYTKKTKEKIKNNFSYKIMLISNKYNKNEINIKEAVKELEEIMKDEDLK